MAIKTYKIINAPDITVTAYNTCLTDAGGDVPTAMVLMKDSVLLPNAKDPTNPTLPEMMLCGYLSSLCQNQGGTLAVNGADIEITIDESFAEPAVIDLWLEEVV